MNRPVFAPLAFFVVAALVSAQPATAQKATFFALDPVTGKPRGSEAHDIREDGRVVVGEKLFRGPVRWKGDDGYEGLGPSGIDPYGRAFGISADGRAIVGEWYRLPFRWTPQGGLVTLGETEGRAHDVSADGNIVVGSRGVGADHAFRWTADEGFLDLGTLGGADGISNAYAVSDDGRVIVGRSMTPAGAYRAFRWSEKDGLRDLGALGERGSVAYGASYDGRVIVGATTGKERRAFVWTAKNGMQALDRIEPRPSAAYDVSDDGSVVVGTMQAYRDFQACIWIDGEPRYLHGLLKHHYGIDIGDWFALSDIRCCSGDGTKFAGSGVVSPNRWAFVATIPPPPKMRTLIEPAGNYRAKVGETFGYPFFAHDPGGEPLTFGVAGLPPGATVTPTPGPAGGSMYGFLRWTPTEADRGTTYDVHLYVRDVEKRRASLRFRLRAVAADSAVASDDEPVANAPRHRTERPFAAPVRVAAATAQEIAFDVYAKGGISSLAAEAYQAADAAQALGEAADALIDQAHARSSTADELANYQALRAKQAEASLVASDRLYQLYAIEANEAALVAGVHACRAGLYAVMDLAERTGPAP